MCETCIDAAPRAAPCDGKLSLSAQVQLEQCVKSLLKARKNGGMSMMIARGAAACYEPPRVAVARLRAAVASGGDLNARTELRKPGFSPFDLAAGQYMPLFWHVLTSIHSWPIAEQRLMLASLTDGGADFTATSTKDATSYERQFQPYSVVLYVMDRLKTYEMDRVPFLAAGLFCSVVRTARHQGLCLSAHANPYQQPSSMHLLSQGGLNTAASGSMEERLDGAYGSALHVAAGRGPWWATRALM